MPSGNCISSWSWIKKKSCGIVYDSEGWLGMTIRDFRDVGRVIFIGGAAWGFQEEMRTADMKFWFLLCSFWLCSGNRNWTLQHLSQEAEVHEDLSWCLWFNLALQCLIKVLNEVDFDLKIIEIVVWFLNKIFFFFVSEWVCVDKSV